MPVLRVAWFGQNWSDVPLPEADRAVEDTDTSALTNAAGIGVGGIEGLVGADIIFGITLLPHQLTLCFPFSIVL